MCTTRIFVLWSLECREIDTVGFYSSSSNRRRSEGDDEPERLVSIPKVPGRVLKESYELPFDSWERRPERPIYSRRTTSYEIVLINI